MNQFSYKDHLSSVGSHSHKSQTHRDSANTLLNCTLEKSESWQVHCVSGKPSCEWRMVWLRRAFLPCGLEHRVSTICGLGELSFSLSTCSLLFFGRSRLWRFLLVSLLLELIIIIIISTLFVFLWCAFIIFIGHLALLNIHFYKTSSGFVTMRCSPWVNRIQVTNRFWKEYGDWSPMRSKFCTLCITHI